MVKKKAGKRSAKHIKEMLEASYQDAPPETIDGFVLDKELSNKTGKVYYNPTTGEANIIHRGTSGTADWLNNLAYGVGAYELTSRYKTGKRTQDRAEKKYGKKNISTLGHSQGAVLARKLGKDTKEIININPAYSFENPSKNEYNIRSSSDVVSSLYAPVAKTRKILYPKYSKKHDITIPSKSSLDILGEHSYSILDRLGDKEIGAGGKRYKQLGYNGDDIDWIGGSVGTPYINQGTNPYGVKGGTTYAQRLARRTRNTFKPVEKAFKPVEKTFDKAGKTLQSGFAKMGMAMGDLTNNYLLPATVAVGKPIYDATAEGASTLLTGNPVLGKVVADSLWNNMVAKQGYDPRKNQKSKLLGEISGETGKAVAKPFQGAVFGAGKNEMFGGTTIADVIPPDITLPVIGAVLGALGLSFTALQSYRNREQIARLINGYFGRNVVAPANLAQLANIQPHQPVFEVLPPRAGQPLQEGKRGEDYDSNDYSSSSDDDSDSDSDDVEQQRGAVGNGSGRKIDFGKIKWGSFERMFHDFKRENPKARVKDLETFAKRIVKNKKKFSDKAFKKANFYLNVLKKST